MEKVNALMLVKIKKVEQETVVVFTEEDGTQRKESHPHVHYETPQIPGTKNRVLAMNPAAPNEEQLWLVSAGRPVIIAMSGEPDFEWLTIEGAQRHASGWGSATNIAEIAEAAGGVIEPHV